MDITQRFKAGVMSVKVQRRGELLLPPDKNRILPKYHSSSSSSSSSSKLSKAEKATTTNNTATTLHQRDEFSKQSKDVCHKITALRDFLLENRTAYMRIGQHLRNSTQMTDEQRDLIDRESEKFFMHYTQHLAKMRSDWKTAKRKPQQKQHIEAVLDLLETYLRSVQNIYLKQKKYRIQHELETYRLIKLAADKKKIPVRPASENIGKLINKSAQWYLNSNESFNNLDENDEENLDTNYINLKMNGDWNNDDDDEDLIDLIDKQEISKTNKTANKKKPQKSTSQQNTQDALNLSASSTTSDLRLQQTKSSQEVALDEDLQKSQQLEEDEAAATKLNPEDVQMFEQENLQLYHELQGLNEEVELIEKNVVDIAQLQDIFTEKVSLQQHNIERIANAVIGATENVKDANDQIKQAITRNAGLRVWSLFFLLVMSFALLFLDWYYD